VIARAAYKGGMTRGAPTATQVADRFHLLQNLAEVLEQVLRTQGKALKTVTASASSGKNK